MSGSFPAFPELGSHTIVKCSDSLLTSFGVAMQLLTVFSVLFCFLQEHVTIFVVLRNKNTKPFFWF